MYSRVPPGQDLPQGLQSPLDYAVTARDGAVLRMVADALKRRRVCLAFQPVMQTGRQARAAFWEGLVRVLDQTGRTIPARDFVPSIEAHELGREIDTLSLELGFEALRVAPDLRLSLNLSARSIGYPRFQDTLDRGIAADRTAAERLILEIGESSAMLMPDTVRVFMQRMQPTGLCFALDNFGAGMTSFRHLRDFDFDILKIDGSFTGSIARTPDNQVLVQAIIGVASAFDMFTVAEKVEDPADAEWLSAAGVDCMQGYCFGAPTLTPWWLIGDEAGRRAG